MNAKRIVLSMALLGGVAAAPAVVAAQPTPRPESPVAAARRAANEALTALNTAKAGAAASRAKVSATFKTANPEYAKAAEDAAKAKAEYAAAREAALSTVRASAEHKAAVAGKTAAQAKIRQLANARGQEKELEAAYAENTTHTTAILKMETAAVDANPKLNEARAKEAETAKAMDGYKAQLDAAYLADPEVVAADAAVLQAETTYKSALEAVKSTAASARPTPTPPK